MAVTRKQSKSGADFSLCAFLSTQCKPKPHRLKPVPLEPQQEPAQLQSRIRLLHDIADAAGYLSATGIEQAEIVRVRPFRADRRIPIAERDTSVGREIPARRRC